MFSFRTPFSVFGFDNLCLFSFYVTRRCWLYNIMKICKLYTTLFFCRMNTSNVTENLTSQSVMILNLQLPWNVVVYLGFTATTIASNGAIAVTLYKQRRKLFKHHHYNLLFQLAVVSCMLSLNCITFIGIPRTYFAISNTPNVMSNLMCALTMMFSQEYLTHVDGMNVVFVSGDRFLAVAFPFAYKNVNKCYKLGTLLFPWLYGCMHLIAKFSTYTGNFAQTTPVICSITYTRTDSYQAFLSFCSILICVLTILFYSCAFLLVLFKIHYSDKNNSKILKKELGFKLLVSSGTDGLIYSCSYVVCVAFTVFVLTNVPIMLQIQLVPLSSGFYYLSLIPRFLVLYFLNTDFKKAVTSNFITNVVSTMSVVGN